MYLKGLKNKLVHKFMPTCGPEQLTGRSRELISLFLKWDVKLSITAPSWKNKKDLCLSRTSVWTFRKKGLCTL